MSQRYGQGPFILRYQRLWLREISGFGRADKAGRLFERSEPLRRAAIGAHRFWQRGWRKLAQPSDQALKIERLFLRS